MKLKLSLLTLGLIVSLSGIAQDVSVDEIIDNYFENTGGEDAWKELKGIKMQAKVNQGGLEIPLEIVQMADGRQYTKISLQGNTIMQGVYDGEVLWNTNFQSQKAEKADAESTAIQALQSNDFPESLLDYKSKGYTAELVGTETIEGTETYKLKLTREPVTVDGIEKADITYYFFDMDNFVPIAQEREIFQGPQKGAIGTSTISDYDEVGGLYFPFSLTQGIKGGPSQPIIIDEIELNPEVSDSDFAFPAEN